MRFFKLCNAIHKRFLIGELIIIIIIKYNNLKKIIYFIYIRKKEQSNVLKIIFYLKI